MTSLDVALPGRLGSPEPLHEGLPPLHFEKMSCTACHAGPSPTAEAKHFMTSLAHGLGSKGHRTGAEWPAILGPVFAPVQRSMTAHATDEDSPAEPSGLDQTESIHMSQIHPQAMMWPSYFGKVVGDEIIPLDPDAVYDATRRALRVRKDFVAEIAQPKLSRGDREAVLGKDRAGVDDDELTDAEQTALQTKQSKIGFQAFDEKVAKALDAIQSTMNVKRAAYVSTGRIFVTRTSADLRGDEAADDTVAVEQLATLDPLRFQTTTAGGAESDVAESDGASVFRGNDPVGPVMWPIAHQVRGAGRSLGVRGCLECHSENGHVFTSTVTSIGPAPVAGVTVTMASLQGVDEDQRLRWNQMFAGRGLFKFVIAGSLVAVLLALLMGVAAKAGAMFAD